MQDQSKNRCSAGYYRHHYGDDGLCLNCREPRERKEWDADTAAASAKYPKGMNYAGLLTWLLAVLILVLPAHAAFLDISSRNGYATIHLDKDLPNGFIAANEGAYVFDDRLVSVIGGGWSAAADLIYLAPPISANLPFSVDVSGLSILPPYSFYNLTDGKQNRLIEPATFLINRSNNAVWAITYNPIFDNRWDIWGSVYTDVGAIVPGDVVSMVIPLGDANLDGVVDASDLSIVLDHFNGSDLWSDPVGLSDLSGVLNHFGARYVPSAPSVAVVPEPGTLAILPVVLLTKRWK